MKKLIAIIFAATIILGVTALTSYAAEPAPEAITQEDATDEATVSPFDEVMLFIESNADKILSALAFIGSIVLAFTYKRDLLPALSKTLSSIGSSVKSIGESTERSLTDNAGTLSDIGERINDVSELFERLSADVGRLDEKLSSYEDNKCSTAAMQEIMRAQVDMLYEIFMTSSLPQYAKDSVGERIALMKERLADGDQNDE